MRAPTPKQRITSAIAIFAMVLLFVAPLVSKILQHNESALPHTSVSVPANAPIQYTTKEGNNSSLYIVDGLENAHVQPAIAAVHSQMTNSDGHAHHSMPKNQPVDEKVHETMHAHNHPPSAAAAKHQLSHSHKHPSPDTASEASESNAAIGHGNHHSEHEIACDYCELLLHVSLILWIFIPLLWLLLLLARVATIRTLIAPALKSAITKQQPRAPPACTRMAIRLLY